MLTNYGICHSCRSPDHSFDACPYKKKCVTCAFGTQRWLVAVLGLDVLLKPGIVEMKTFASSLICLRVQDGRMAEGGKITLKLTIPYDKDKNKKERDM